jgi:hypothetical protein
VAYPVMNRRISLVVICFTILPLHHAVGWGSTGHSIVAEIAQRRLEPSALREIAELVEGQVSLILYRNVG